LKRGLSEPVVAEQEEQVDGHQLRVAGARREVLVEDAQSLHGQLVLADVARHQREVDVRLVELSFSFPITCELHFRRVRLSRVDRVEGPHHELQPVDQPARAVRVLLGDRVS
jgi:hypothetical protein